MWDICIKQFEQAGMAFTSYFSWESWTRPEEGVTHCGCTFGMVVWWQNANMLNKNEKEERASIMSTQNDVIRPTRVKHKSAQIVQIWAKKKKKIIKKRLLFSATDMICWFHVHHISVLVPTVIFISLLFSVKRLWKRDWAVKRVQTHPTVCFS